MTAKATRRKQQQDLIKKTLQQEEEKRFRARECFPLTTVALALQAAHEPALYHSDEFEEGM